MRTIITPPIGPTRTRSFLIISGGAILPPPRSIDVIAVLVFAPIGRTPPMTLRTVTVVFTIIVGTLIPISPRASPEREEASLIIVIRVITAIAMAVFIIIGLAVVKVPGWPMILVTSCCWPRAPVIPEPFSPRCPSGGAWRRGRLGSMSVTCGHDRLCLCRPLAGFDRVCLSGRSRSCVLSLTGDNSSSYSLSCCLSSTNTTARGGIFGLPCSRRLRGSRCLYRSRRLGGGRRLRRGRRLDRGTGNTCRSLACRTCLSRLASALGGSSGSFSGTSCSRSLASA